MPNPPFVFTAKTAQEVVDQLNYWLEDLYSDRVGGALLGDVFTVSGDDDILTLQISSGGGLEKSSGELQVHLYSASGLEMNTNGLRIDIKASGGLLLESEGISVLVEADKGLTLGASGLAVELKTGYGIDVDSDGLKLKQQAHIANASTTHAVTDWATTNTALDALGTKINAILTALETAEILASS